MSQGTKAADLLQWFRALGGVADNVQLRQGPHGWGLFVVDPEQPVRGVHPGSPVDRTAGPVLEP